MGKASMPSPTSAAEQAMKQGHGTRPRLSPSSTPVYPERKLQSCDARVPASVKDTPHAGAASSRQSRKQRVKPNHKLDQQGFTVVIPYSRDRSGHDDDDDLEEDDDVNSLNMEDLFGLDAAPDVSESSEEGGSVTSSASTSRKAQQGGMLKRRHRKVHHPTAAVVATSLDGGSHHGGGSSHHRRSSTAGTIIPSSKEEARIHENIPMRERRRRSLTMNTALEGSEEHSTRRSRTVRRGSCHASSATERPRDRSQSVSRHRRRTSISHDDDQPSYNCEQVESSTHSSPGKSVRKHLRQEEDGDTRATRSRSQSRSRKSSAQEGGRHERSSRSQSRSRSKSRSRSQSRRSRSKSQKSRRSKSKSAKSKQNESTASLYNDTDEDEDETILAAAAAAKEESKRKSKKKSSKDPKKKSSRKHESQGRHRSKSRSRRRPRGRGPEPQSTPPDETTSTTEDSTNHSSFSSLPYYSTSLEELGLDETPRTKKALVRKLLQSNKVKEKMHGDDMGEAFDRIRIKFVEKRKQEKRKSITTAAAIS